MACATGPLIVDHGARNNIRYNAAAADWTQRRDSLAGEGTAFMDTAHWLNSALRTKFETRAGNASTTYARLDFLFFEALSQFFGRSYSPLDTCPNLHNDYHDGDPRRL